MASSTTNGSGEQQRPLGAAVRALASLSDAELRQLGVLLERQRWGDANWGQQFWDKTNNVYKRKLYTSLGYDTELTLDHYHARYARGGIARRIVRLYPRATWTAGVDIVEDPDPGVLTPFEDAVLQLFGRLDVWSKLLRADILRGLGHYSVLLIGQAGDLSQPLKNFGSPDQLLYLTPIAEKRVDELTTEEDPRDPRYGLPKTYRIDFGGQVKQKEVHWSRLLHLAEDALEDDTLGEPVLKDIWNYLDDLDKIIGGGAESQWRRASPLTQADLDPDVEYDATAQAKLQAQLEDVLHDLKPFLRTRGVTLKQLSDTVQPFGGNADAVQKLIAATKGAPVRILFGSERGELASSQDRNNWNDRVTERRQEFAEPLIRDFIGRLIEHRALPQPQQWEPVWPEREELDEKEKAEVAGRLASANERQFVAEGEILVTANEIRQNYLGLGPLEEIDQGATANRAMRPTREKLRAAKLRLASSRRRSAADTAERERNVAEWKAVHRVADEHRGALAEFVVDAWKVGADSFDADAFVAALERQDAGEAEAVALRAVEMATRHLAEETPAHLLSVLAAGGQAGLKSVLGRGSFFRSSCGGSRGGDRYSAEHRFRANFTASFDQANPRAVNWADTRSSELVTETTAETRAAIRSIVADGFRDGIPPRQLAKRIEAVIGLRSDQVATLDRLRTTLLEEGVAPGVVESRIAKRAAKMLRQRAVLIARTESMRAANEGLRELWRQAQDNGQLPADAQRVWITTQDGNAREEHADHDGAVTGVNEPWPWGYEPGAQPNCRCGQGIATPEDLERAAA